jgi:signal transduction histidine kinase
MQSFQSSDTTTKPTAPDLSQMQEQHPSSTKEMEQSELPSTRTAESFLRLAHHELQSPLTAIRVQAQLAETYLKRQNTAAVAAALTTIQEQSVQMEHLLKDLLDAARLQDGRLSIRPTTLDIVGLCRQMVTLQTQITGRPIQFLKPMESLPVQVDGQRLCQVLANLLANACKYTALDQPIEVELVPTTTKDEKGDCHSWVTICVRDGGQGISVEELPRIFGLFYRSHQGVDASGERSGLGLGLALCAEIVAVSGGWLWVESIPGGGGSTFFVRLPVLNPSIKVEIE